MTAFTDFAALKTAVKYPKRRSANSWVMTSSTAGPVTAASLVGQSAFLKAPATNPGVAPGAAANPDNSSPGALMREATDSTTLWLAEIIAAAAPQTGASSGNLALGCFLIYDRLAHSSGLDGTLNTTQTTNLPVTLPARAPANGVGCFAALEVYAALGNTLSVATVSYKNTAGATKTCPFTPQMSTTVPFAAAGAFHILPLADGDLGVKTIESVTLSASTATAGNFGCVIGQPLAIVMAGESAGNPGIIMPLQGGNLVQIPDTACLQAVFISLRGASLNTTVPQLYLEMVAARAQ